MSKKSFFVVIKLSESTDPILNTEKILFVLYTTEKMAQLFIFSKNYGMKDREEYIRYHLYKLTSCNRFEIINSILGYEFDSLEKQDSIFANFLDPKYVGIHYGYINIIYSKTYKYKNPYIYSEYVNLIKLVKYSKEDVENELELLKIDNPEIKYEYGSYKIYTFSN